MQPKPSRRQNSLDTQTLAHTIIAILDDKQAEDILLLDIGETSPFADYFVIATATSERQSQALLSSLNDELRPQKIRALHIEGERTSGWQLVDYGNVIVHIFSPEQRSFYRLEELWSNAKVVVRMQ
ncbi:MAG: ribosome silencing factor [Chloroflexi bacterium]|nr:ribosome silencing factor [Chloroflexota bacterium]